MVRILLIDDDPAGARVVAGLLRDAGDLGHEVVHAPSLDALPGIVAGGVDPDVVLLDPATDGTSVTEAVHRVLDVLGDVPVVVHAGAGERDVRIESVAAGAEDHLVKGRATGEDIARALAAAVERHRGHRAIAEALTQVELANGELRRMQRAQDEFVAIAAHELRTPVTVASGFVRLLAERDEQLSGDQRRDLLARTNAAMARLRALTDDLLAVSRAGHGRTDPRAAAVPLAAAVADGLRTSRIDPADAAVDVPGDLVVVADHAQLTRVLRNLLDNAVVHGRPPVDVTARRVGPAVHLRVADDGPGVPASFVDSMFDRFTQADSSTVREAEGTGLGLAIVRGLVEAVGGRVSYETSATGGAAFTVVLRPAVVAGGSPDGVGAAGTHAGDPREPVEALDQA